MNKNKSINDFLKYQKIAQQLSNSVLNENSDSERELLNEFVSDEANREKLINRLKNSDDAERKYQDIDKRDKEADIYKLTIRLEKQHRRRVHRRVAISVASVAATVLFLFIMLYDFNRDPAHELIANVQREITKIKLTPIVPIIVYDNGGKVVLENQNSLSVNGNSIAKVDNNKLEYINNNLDTVLFATLIIPVKNKYTVVLPDGTEVCLNANSSLRYPSRFDGERCVELSGEAFFKVSKSDIPFKVMVEGVEVKVYGTEFNILAYNQDKVITTLLSGSVGVKYKSNNKNVETRIKPHERITIETKSGEAKIDKNVNVIKYKSLEQNYFRHDEEPLGELLDAISNWYGVEFVCIDEEIRNRTVSASLENSMDVDNILKILELSSKVKFIKKGGKYVVK